VANHAAFLRGVNLASRRRVSAADLRSCFEGLGFDDVAAFRASGNVVFEARREPRPKMTARIEKALAKSLGFEVSVFIRTADEVRAVAEHQPFGRKAVAASMGKLQVLLLAGSPSARARTQVQSLETPKDRLELGTRELFWLPSGGTQQSALDLAAIEKLVGPTTMRTKGTVEQMAAKFFSG
jgi:uncharacterized protein (DUF1697 family)